VEIESRGPSTSQRIHLLRSALSVLPSLIDQCAGTLIGIADEMMHASKTSGKNKVTVAVSVTD
jgi:ABC-type molybdate transport system permease subunit